MMPHSITWKFHHTYPTTLNNDTQILVITFLADKIFLLTHIQWQFDTYLARHKIIRSLTDYLSGKTTAQLQTAPKSTYIILYMRFQHYKNRQIHKSHTQEYWDHTKYSQTDVVKHWETHQLSPLQIHHLTATQPNSWLYNHQTTCPTKIVLHTKNP